MRPEQLNKCATNEGNVGRAIQCLSMRISKFAGELERIERELEALILQEINDREKFLAQESDRAQERENFLEESITQESNRAQERENSLEEYISQTNANINQNNEEYSRTFQQINESIAQERGRATEAEGVLQERLNNERERAIDQERNLTNLINQENYRATQAEEELLRAIENEETRAKNSENALQNSINSLSSQEEDRAKIAEQSLYDKIDQDILTEKTRAEGIEQSLLDKINSDIQTEKERAEAAEQANANNISDIQSKIPEAASASNQLADKNFVNSSVATSTATFHGSKNLIDDLSLTVSASHADIEAALATIFTSGIDNNDYCFVRVPTSNEDSSEIAFTERYKFNGTRWYFEYVLNTSGFSSSQWDAINSGINAENLASILRRIQDLETALDGIKLKKITSQAYSSLQNKDANTLYVLND